MNVVYDPQIFAAQQYGGVSRYYCEVATRIARFRDVNATIVAPMHINAYLEHVPRDILKGFRAPDLNNLKLQRGTRYLQLIPRGLGMLFGDAMIRKIRPDVVHETYFFPYRLGGKRPRRVLTIYDMVHEKFASEFKLSDRTTRYKMLAANRADHVICISESTRRDAIELLGLNKDQTTVTHLGYDLMEVANEKLEAAPSPAAGPYLLYVGRRGGYKNFDRLLDVYRGSQVLKSEFKLVCFGGGGFNRKELELIRCYGLKSDQVKQISGNDRLLSQLYRFASVFVYPSLYEGFGIPPLEAMSNGCPVACSNTSSIPEVVGDAGEYFNPYDPDSIRIAIERVVLSPERREKLLALGRERVKLFSWDRCASETLEVYKRLA